MPSGSPPNSRRVLSETSRHGEAYTLDAEIRPEGRKGPMARSLDSYRRYYEEWAEPWEILALVRGRVVAGDQALGDQWSEMAGTFLWRGSLPVDFQRSIREIKARVEKERIPAGEDPDYHLKLGRGSLSDIEFLTQLLQMRHGGAIPELRVPGTLDALQVLVSQGLIETEEESALSESFLFCTRVRLRLHLQMGRAVRLAAHCPQRADQPRRLARIRPCLRAPGPVSPGHEEGSAHLRDRLLRVSTSTCSSRFGTG